MSTNKRTRLRAVTVIGAVVVVAALGTVTYNASASENTAGADGGATDIYRRGHGGPGGPFGPGGRFGRPGFPPGGPGSLAPDPGASSPGFDDEDGIEDEIGAGDEGEDEIGAGDEGDDEIGAGDEGDDEGDDGDSGPAELAPPAGSVRLGSADVVEGTQTYTCTGGKFTGASVPEARLEGDEPFAEIHHFKGPSWQSEDDESLVTAAKDKELAKAGSIPELLLKVNSHTGDGVMSKVNFIQRLDTEGGVAPGEACTDGATQAVPYTATYVFFS